MATTEITYTYEYQGNVAKLVHTPLTDKCYLTLTLVRNSFLEFLLIVNFFFYKCIITELQCLIMEYHKALRMGLGGNPYGPAGTGKTESVKALGSLLGRQVLVFNCDEVCLNQNHVPCYY